jgi:hypothetical protein
MLAEKQAADYSKLKAKQAKFQVSCRIWKDMYFMLSWNLLFRVRIYILSPLKCDKVLVEICLTAETIWN